MTNTPAKPLGLLSNLNDEQLGYCLMHAAAEEIITHEQLGQIVRTRSVSNLTDEELGMLLTAGYHEDFFEPCDLFEGFSDENELFEIEVAGRVEQS